MIKKLFKKSHITKKCQPLVFRKFSVSEQREEIEYDVAIIGGGPSGLATAIRLKQLEKEQDKEINVCLIEKGSEVGSHLLSGNCFQPNAFERLFPDWETSFSKENYPPINQQVSRDEFSILLPKDYALKIPSFLYPHGIRNHGNYIISLGELGAWMAEQAEEMGVDIYSGFAGDKLIRDDKSGAVKGIVTSDLGIDKNGEQKDTFQQGIAILAKQTVLAEGCRGSLTEQAIQNFHLAHESDPQIYGIGLKEVWEVSNDNFEPGLVKHTVGWPVTKKYLRDSTYSGTFMYHMESEGRKLIHLGMVVGLDYKNPYLNPYQEFQNWKQHSEIKKHLEGGTCLKYGARALNEGGYFSVPQLSFPGGVIVGCGGGLLDISKIKGTHNAIDSGIEAAEAIHHQIHYGQEKTEGVNLKKYDQKIKSSIGKELKKSRNFHGGFKFGLFPGMALGILSDILGGREPWNLRNSKKDCDTTQKAALHSVNNF